MLLKNKFYDEYYNIIEEANKLNRVKYKEVYYESHHIIPRCMGGSDDHENLVLLTAQEHYRCHELLPYFTEGENKAKMIYAWNLMSRLKEVTIDSEKYEELRTIYSSIHSINMTGKSHPNYGNPRNFKHTKLTKDTMAKARKGDKHPMHGKKHSKESKAKMSNSAIGRSHSDESKLLMSRNNQRKSGKEHAFYNKRHSDESKNLISLNLPKGKDHTNWKGYWVTPFGKFETLKEIDESNSLLNGRAMSGISKSLDKIISINSFSASKYLKSIGTKKDIVGKTFRELGFSFEPK